MRNKKHKRLLTLFLSLTMTICMGIGNVIMAAPTNANLLNTYGTVFDKFGAEVVYSELCDSRILAHLKSQYNSTTIGNEMKPDSILGWAPNLISVSDARRMGYYIPANYTEPTVPKLNLNQVDTILKTCYENGIALRAHTLVWHSQTPDWYFRSGYNKNAGYVDQNAMNARMEMYIKTYMNYVHSHQYGSVVYAWDVVNEYIHANASGWSRIYGTPGTRAGFVKKAFEYAHEYLEQHNLTDSVSLFYNDYNTYMDTDKIIDLVNYINSGKKICNGVGMQAHLSTNFPSVSSFENTIKRFASQGYEIQITELDVANTSDSQLSKYYYDLFKAILNAKKSGANITSVTFWGVSDSNSWISSKNPLLFRNIDTPKDAYYSVLKAYTDSGYSVGSDENPDQPTNPDKPNPNYVTLNDGWYYIKNTSAQKYLQVKDNKGANGQNVEINAGTGVAGQKWQLANVGDGYITLKNGNGYMLDVDYGKNENTTNIQTYSANGQSAQLFKILPTNQNDVYGVVTKCSIDTKGLDVSNKSTENGANVQQYFYYGAGNQTWSFESCPAPGEHQTTPTEPTNPDQPTPPETDHMVSVKLLSDWGDGATADITLTNLTGNDLEGWTCTFTTDRPITSVWNAELIHQEGNTYTFTNPAWQPHLDANGSYTFGCCMGQGPSNVTVTNAFLK